MKMEATKHRLTEILVIKTEGDKTISSDHKRRGTILATITQQCSKSLKRKRSFSKKDEERGRLKNQ